MRRHHRQLIVVAALLVTAWAPASAAAHAVMEPGAGRPAELVRYTLTIPNERGVPTTSVRLTVPAGIDFFLVEKKLGWKTHIEKRNGHIAAVVFDGGTIPPDVYDTFRLIAKNPVQEGTIAWDVEQAYAGGEVVRWTGPPGSDTPAARTRIAESAVPVDVVDVAGGKTAAVSAASITSEVGRDRLALVLAGAAIGLALLALAIPFLRGRPIA